jgi:ribosomal protein S21
MHVVARPGERFESLFSRYQQALAASGIVREARRRRWFESPAERRRLRRRLAAQRERSRAARAAS